jgi:hypothetical protein
MIALSGAIARRKLRETPVFLRSQEQLKKSSDSIISRETTMAYFLIYAGYPLCFYLTYIYCADILKHTHHYTAEQVINHNLFITIFSSFIGISLIFLVKKFDALKIVKIRGIFSTVVLFSMPLIPLSNIYYLTGFQVLLTIFALGTIPAVPIFFKHFPVHRRFTYSSMLYALSRAIMYVATSFGLVYLTDYFGYYGIWVVMLPVSIGFIWGVKHFQKLENNVSGEESFLLAV